MQLKKQKENEQYFSYNIPKEEKKKSDAVLIIQEDSRRFSSFLKK